MRLANTIFSAMFGQAKRAKQTVKDPLQALEDLYWQKVAQSDSVKRSGSKNGFYVYHASSQEHDLCAQVDFERNNGSINYRVHIYEGSIPVRSTALFDFELSTDANNENIKSDNPIQKEFFETSIAPELDAPLPTEIPSSIWNAPKDMI